MATITSTDPTLLDLIKQLKDDEFMPIINTLMEEFEALEDMVWVEANGMTEHTYVQTLNEPTGSWRSINEGVPTERAQFKQLLEQMAFLEAYSRVDDRLVRLSGDKQRYRSNQDVRFISGMGKTFASAFIEPLSDGKGFNGLKGRLNALSMANVFSNGGSAHRTSVFGIQWGENKIHMIYPNGWKHGLEKKDLGLKVVYDENNNPYEAWMSNYKLAVGLVINNMDNIMRIANIDSTSDVETSGLDDKLIEALNLMPGRGKGTILYMDTSLLTQFDIAVKDKTNLSLSINDAFGRPVTTFLGHPLKLIEKIGAAEAAVS